MIDVYKNQNAAFLSQKIKKSSEIIRLTFLALTLGV